jgi:hypothetical protein
MQRTATIYLQFEKGRYSSEMKVVNTTQRKPKKILRPTVAINVSLPDSAFEPFSVVTIDVPEGAVIEPTVEVQG